MDGSLGYSVLRRDVVDRWEAWGIRDMLQPIELGKRYLLNIRPNPEYRCPGCDCMYGEATLERHSINGTVVTVLAQPLDPAWCQRCGFQEQGHEGEYRVVDSHGMHWRIPYVWLEPLAAEEE
ncbi:hypothetical protein LCGC14_1850620 [marine sediment metagenome]|uniref:Uncharacterized protein n=1 Tax=marine sediment metagenome TaxID=412755 RepID=A0A0F9GAG3_9ZZZZ